MWLNSFKYSEEIVSGVCRILSTGETFLPSLSEDPTRSKVRGYQPREIFKIITRVAIAVEKLPPPSGKKCDASTTQSNNFGVSRKRFKPSTLGSAGTVDSIFARILQKGFGNVLSTYALVYIERRVCVCVAVLGRRRRGTLASSTSTCTWRACLATTRSGYSPPHLVHSTSM